METSSKIAVPVWVASALLVVVLLLTVDLSARVRRLESAVVRLETRLEFMPDNAALPLPGGAQANQANHTRQEPAKKNLRIIVDSDKGPYYSDFCSTVGHGCDNVFSHNWLQRF